MQQVRSRGILPGDGGRRKDGQRGLYVRPTARRRGVGGHLLQAAVGRARAAGCRKVHLLVDPDNAGATAFYEPAGFTCDSFDMVLRL